MSVLVEIFKPGEASPLRISSGKSAVNSAFSSPTDHFLEDSLDLNKEFVKNSATTYYARIVGNSTGSDFSEGDVLVVDRSLPLQHNKLVVCFMSGCFTARKLCLKDTTLWLEALDTAFEPIELSENNQHIVWGLVTYVVKRVW